jgi:mannosyl-oligosaccharide alpha-1,2-mannosidase
MYRAALPTFSKNLFFRPSLPGNPDILFSGSLYALANPPKLETQVQHLGCFVGGMVALGARMANSAEELETARKLTDGCVWAYQNTPSGIMPEIFHVEACPDPDSCTWEGTGTGFRSVEDPTYQLRPEAIESVFIMYRITGEQVWQDAAWRMFQAIERVSRTEIAAAAIDDITVAKADIKVQQADSMESFWLAETLKYFYLIFDDFSNVSLDEYVLNTEAHPLKRPGK